MNLLRSFTRAGLAAALLLLLAAPASRAQTLYVGNLGDNTVRSFSLATGMATPGFAAISLTNPLGLALSGNALYATSFDSSAGTLSAYDATTGLALAGFTTVTGLAGPTGVVFAGGNLYVANYDGNNITAYNATTGAQDLAYISPLTGLSQPIGLAISGGTLYVGTAGDGKVQAFNLATGVALPTFPAILLSQPRGLTLSGTALYATSSFDNTLSAYDATTGAALPGFTTATSADGLNFPWQVAASGGNLYVANFGGDNITAYNATTGAQDLAYTSTSPAGLSFPPSIAISNIVPEPGSAALLAGGLAALACLRRRPRG